MFAVVFNNKHLRLDFTGGKVLVSLLHTEIKCPFPDSETSMEV